MIVGQLMWLYPEPVPDPVPDDWAKHGGGELVFISSVDGDSISVVKISTVQTVITDKRFLTPLVADR